MLIFAWNLLALLMVPVAGVWGYALVRMTAAGPLLVTFVLLAALSWGFYQRRFARWRTVVGWTYSGLSLGTMGGVGASTQPFWVSALAVIVSGVLLLLLPDRFNRLFWTAALLRNRPPGWSGPQTQSREQVLADSPFTLHEVVKVTEQLVGGVVQQSGRKLDRLECRYRGEPVETAQQATGLEEWILARYRHYRHLRRLPVSAEVAPDREVVREEEQPLETYSTEAWHGRTKLGLFQVLESSPFELWVTFLRSGTGEQEPEYQVLYRTGLGITGPDTEGMGAVQERLYSYTQGRDYAEISQAESERSGMIVEKVTLKLRRTGRTLGSYPDLASAEAEVWARYLSQRGRDQRAEDGKEQSGGQEASGGKNP
ncbi:hypothetical protein Q0M94_14000 [Deinococcus radiomollis]|uniref:hypothetical protein n=1 Tax=Deinococcus radiomollis TaxID=468916 RepID=UPI0038921900